MEKNFIFFGREPDCMKNQVTLKSGRLKIGTLLYKITFCVIFSCSLFTAQSQAQLVRVFNTENSGLPHNQVTSIAIDAEGNKWFGTFYGEVVKFDNANWTVYNSTNSGLPGEYRISSIAIDAQDNKWFGASFTPNLGTGGGLVKFDNTNWTIYNRSNSGLPNNTVTAIAIDSLGNKWIGTRGGGIVKYDGIQWTQKYSRLQSGNVFAIKVDGHGSKWIATHSEIVKFDNTNLTAFNYSKSIIPYYNGNGGITSIAIDDEGNKWFGIAEDWDSGANGGVTKFDDVNWTIYSSNNSDLSYSVHCIAIDDEGNKWFGTSYWSVGALVKFDGSTWTVYDSSNSGFPNDWIESLAIDDQGNKWFTTGNSGVVVFNENGITTGLNDNMSVVPDDFKVYPNPAKDLITIEGLQAGTLSIFNLTGELIKNYKLSGTTTQIDVSSLPAGVYTIRAMAKDKLAVKKIIKKQ